ncbi:putative pheromone binding protein [Agrilactobacillus composti DSM 18527 = JCM 14202]|uniref:Putative pheromone binding protein n=1 Tax=Agrilactobacillus composti DSM 18527 = JCM 14202 TaxID=1423734 RepID=X0PPP9_9LACO|nr:peptide ABC transporter substrate-binding protein [Agrilactobacillus composti]KRM30472.1 putative pheromone binding protein [Agrilactobacillus composti DSM 18527 = JCM 14202]GAF38961.1 oligopeptide ABC transporter, periplasmic oligopeptide-binding protein OppA [Agrilactobacillus composti DSM 18527 = JCM 14202]
MKKVIPILVIVLLLPFVLAPGTVGAAAKQKVFEASTNMNLDTLDPAAYTSVSSAETIDQINEGLYRYDANNKVVPGMVSGKPKINSAKTVYTYTLRKAYWTNGDPVTAQDFVYGFQRKVSPKNGSSLTDFIKNGQAIRLNQKPTSDLGVEAVDSHTLKITLEQPIPFIEQYLTNAHFMPVNEKFATKVGDKYGTSAATTLSNGPFVLKNWTGTNDSWQLVKNSKYYDAKSVKINQVNVQVIKDTGTLMNLFDSGKLDYGTIGDNNVQKYAGQKVLHKKQTPTIGYISINNKRKNTANVHLRRALAMSYDKKGLTNNFLADGSKPLDGVVPTGLATNPTTNKDYRKDTGNLLSYNPKAAAKEWKLAQKQLGIKNVTIQLLSADTDQAKNVSQYLQSQIESHLKGVTISVKAMPVAQRIQTEQNGDYDIAFGTYVPDYADPMSLLFMFTTDQKLNFSHYSNKDYDADIAAVNGALATKPAARYKKLQAAEKTMMDDAVIAPVYQAGIAYLLSDRFSHFQFQPLGQIAEYRYIQPK